MTKLTYTMNFDALDQEDFNPIDYINQLFPNGEKFISKQRHFNNYLILEESLNQLDTYIIGVGSQISTLDEELSKAIQSQTISGEEASKVT